MYEPSGAVVDEAAVHRAPVQGDVYRCHSCDAELVAGVDKIIEGPYGESFCPDCAVGRATSILTDAWSALSRVERRRLAKASRRRNDGRSKGTSVKKKPKKSTKKGY